jgi:hypothetical protein
MLDFGSMDDEQLDAHAQDAAERFADSILEMEGVQLQADLAGLEWLDHYITNVLRDSPDAFEPESLVELFVDAGFFFGECLIALLGGRWVVMGQPVVLLVKEEGGGPILVMPLRKVELAFEAGASRSLVASYHEEVKTGLDPA